MEDIPDSLIVNWDQTSMKIVPNANWTMEKRGTKRVEIAASDDKRQITLCLLLPLQAISFHLRLYIKEQCQGVCQKL